jgi:hypothetical protein
MAQGQLRRDGPAWLTAASSLSDRRLRAGCVAHRLALLSSRTPSFCTWSNHFYSFARTARFTGPMDTYSTASPFLVVVQPHSTSLLFRLCLWNGQKDKHLERPSKIHIYTKRHEKRVLLISDTLEPRKGSRSKTSKLTWIPIIARTSLAVTYQRMFVFFVFQIVDLCCL